ncbi:transglutaminase domain-containing protein [Patulibacter sp.]|uniref:transglutaminase family protein n=1 Tax=Patulibacter sp. TaxID=1912859 RepID=UPI0027205691|nr:transglutaminase domain-containing protein [Patulibacter sp.]MDO9409405.1 transglutaminase domain-containing protein [Patulibacter sp.]
MSAGASTAAARRPRRAAVSAAGRQEPARGRAVALVLLAAASAIAWWSVLGAGLLWAGPVVLLAVLVTARVLPARLAVVGAVVWLPVGPLLAGVPARELRPGGLDNAAVSLFNGLDALTVPARGAVVADPWPLAAALLLTGLTWCASALLATRRGRVAGLIAIVLPALPLVWALALEQTPDAAWPGAVLLGCGVLWAARGRLTAVVPATVGVAVLAAVLAQAVGPKEQWIPFVDAPGRKPQFSRLDTTQSYGPLGDRRTGQTMLEITSPEPALWRMQVLERFNGRWRVEMRTTPDLPQPAAEEVRSTVEVVGLRNRLVAAPGRVEAVDGGGAIEQDIGEARQLRRAPEKGDRYRVRSEVVRATADQLRDVPVAEGPQYAQYIETWPSRGYGRRPTRPAIDYLDRLRFRGSYGANRFVEVLQLAKRLRGTTNSQLEIVRRVQSYLVDEGRFTYTTDVPPAGSQPLFDFLLDTRAGYCQQFAGAAAMLLRFAGVPTRVVTGFATGTSDGEGRYAVRDEDAHAWIEVYFPGYGWIPFNPTPADAEATVAAEVDVFAPPGSASGTGDGGGPGVLLIPVLAAAVAAGVFVRRRTRHLQDVPAAVPVGELLARLVPGPVGPATTLAALGPRLRELGPATAALAERAERDRFASGGTSTDRHPRLRVWRALADDLGRGRATVLMVRRTTRPREAGGTGID